MSLQNKLFICDLDNALLTADGKITDLYKNVLLLSLHRGLGITFCSSSSMNTVVRILREYPLDYPIVCCDGAFLYDPVKQAVLSEKTISKKDVFDTIQLLLNRFQNLGIVASCALGEWRILRANTYIETARKTAGEYAVHAEPDSLPDSFYKLLLMSNKATIDKVEIFLRATLSSRYITTRTGSCSLTVLSSAVKRSEAVRHIASDLAQKDLIYFGSSSKDIECMDASVECGCANNAPLAVRLLADDITTLNLGEGAAAEYLYKLIFKNEK